MLQLHQGSTVFKSYQDVYLQADIAVELSQNSVEAVGSLVSNGALQGRQCEPTHAHDECSVKVKAPHGITTTPAQRSKRYKMIRNRLNRLSLHFSTSCLFIHVKSINNIKTPHNIDKTQHRQYKLDEAICCVTLYYSNLMYFNLSLGLIVLY